jgi:nicotinamide riboside transporter PnuC
VGTAVTWLEVIAFVLAVAGITLNVLESHWRWPLGLLSSLL